MHSRRRVPSQAAFLFTLWLKADLAAAAQDQLVPPGFLGHWASTPADCPRGEVDGNLLVTTEAFGYPQSRGRVVSARQLAARVMEFQLAMSGEARGRIETRRFSLSDDLHTLSEMAASIPGGSAVRVRCAGVPLAPVDDAIEDADFLAFRARLLRAIDRRDKAFILSIVSPHILNSFGGGGGIEEFERISRLDDADSWFWKEFGTVMRLGGSFANPDSFSAPYTWANWPKNLDAIGNLAVIGRDVNVRAAPSMDSPVIATVSYTTLPHVGTYRQGSEWAYVGLDDGLAGYIHRTFVRSPIDYRAFFSRRDGRWWLDAFVSGD